MDHVPIVTDPVFLPIKVPCLSQEAYDNEIGLWEEYPSTRGWDLLALIRGDFSNGSNANPASFLQDWLFFGVLYEVLGPSAQKERFVRWDIESGQTLVTTKDLNRLLYDRFLSYNDTSREAWIRIASDLDRFGKVLRLLSLFCNVASSSRLIGSTMSQSPWPLSPEIDLSIRALGSYLTKTIYSASWHTQLFTISSTLTFPAGDYAASRMREAGWCPSEIAMMSEHMSPSSLYYASSLRRFQIRKDHTRCDQQVCLANQIDSSTYQTLHVEEGCTCAHLDILASKIIDIIANNGIPLITINVSDGPGELALEVSQFRPGQCYVALSHVWSDGMGNAVTNSLPQCQIRRLKALLDELTWSNGRTWDHFNKGQFSKFWRHFRGRTVAFWLDTLCIPVDRRYKKYRNLAISMMYRIYLSAQDILILDSELQNCSMPSQADEAYLQVFLSGWMRRLWTLQESVLGRRLNVKFLDRVFDLTSEHENQPRSSPLDFAHQAGSPSSDSRSWYWSDRLLRFLIVSERERKLIGTFQTTSFPNTDPAKMKLDRECRAVLRAFVASTFRSSLRKEDEYRCLASLLGWDTTCLNNVPKEESMKTLLRLKDFLPQGLLFVAGQRMPEKGWRWALQNFGNNGCKQLRVGVGTVFDTTPARRCARGLIVEYAGFMFDGSERPLNLDEIIVEVPEFSNGQTWMVKVQRHVGYESVEKEEEKRKVTDSNARRESHDSRSDISLAVLVCDLHSLGVANLYMGAVLVEVEEGGGQAHIDDVDQGVVHCTYVHLVRLEILGRKEAIAATYPQVCDPTVVCKASSGSYKSRRWCVG